MKKLLNHIFIDGLSGMALGLFSTLIVGTIIQQIGNLIGGNIGDMLFIMGKMAAAMTGAGIGVGVAHRYQESPLVVLSAATAGMTGGFASKILAGSLLVDGSVVLAGPGEPLGAFVAAFAGIELGHLVSGKTKVDILVTPIVTIVTGCAVGLIVGPPISKFMTGLGAIINWGTEQQPFIMGIVVSVLMGMILTLPISSAALGIILNLSGLAAGAATIGCCCNMVGFAVASYRGNKVAGLLAKDKKSFLCTEDEVYKSYEVVKNKFVANTTIGAVITNAAFHKTQLCKIASMTHNGYARSIRPVHTTADGDSIYALSTGTLEADLDMVGTLAAQVMSEAILRAVMSAETAYGFPAARDL